MTTTGRLAYLSPNCAAAQDPYVPDDSPEGHPKCGFPGYRHPILGWMAIPCTCSCHTAITSAEQEVGDV